MKRKWMCIAFAIWAIVSVVLFYAAIEDLKKAPDVAVEHGVDEEHEE